MVVKFRRFGRRAFTLVELLAAMSVLVVLVVGIVQMLNNVSSASNGAKLRLETDDQARLVLDCVGQDFNQMVKQGNVDAYFASGSSLNTASGEMFFYAQSPGYILSNPTPSPTSLNGGSLTGYRVNSISASAAYNQLERYSAASQWDGAIANSMVFLTIGTSGSFAPLPATTIPTIVSSGTGAAIVDPTCTDAGFHVLGSDIFRMEFCYQLKDGTYSCQPVLYTQPVTWPTGTGAPTFFNATTGAPTSANGATTYAVGSRWYDSQAGRAYLCTSVTSGSTSNQAAWQALGWQDVSAVVVTIAAMDTNSRALLQAQGRDLKALASALPTVQSASPINPQVSTLPAQLWLGLLNGGTLTSTVPQKAISAVHVYQRCLYLEAQ